MRKLFFLVAAAALSAACHNRSDEEVGAAPDQGSTDTTAVTHAIDSTRFDSTSMGQDTTGMSPAPQDTVRPSADTSGMQGDSTGAMSDTTAADSSSNR